MSGGAQLFRDNYFEFPSAVNPWIDWYTHTTAHTSLFRWFIIVHNAGPSNAEHRSTIQDFCTFSGSRGRTHIYPSDGYAHLRISQSSSGLHLSIEKAKLKLTAAFFIFLSGSRGNLAVSVEVKDDVNPKKTKKTCMIRMLLGIFWFCFCLSCLV